jgi:hypothetical protein
MSKQGIEKGNLSLMGFEELDICNLNSNSTFSNPRALESERIVWDWREAGRTTAFVLAILFKKE